MKKKIMYFVLSFAFAMATVFAYASPSSMAANTCHGRCNEALKVCMKDCKTQGQIQACQKKHERCTSSCKSSCNSCH